MTKIPRGKTITKLIENVDKGTDLKNKSKDIEA